MSHNGHKNRSVWNVALWIANDEPLYHLAMAAKRKWRGRGGCIKAAQELLEILPPTTPGGTRYTKTNLTAALRGI